MNSPQRGLLKRPGSSITQQTPSTPVSSSCNNDVAVMVTNLMNAATTFHKLHLKVQGVGSYAAHKTLDDLYSSMHGFADTIAEGYQGAACCILEYAEVCPETLNTVEEAINMISTLKNSVNVLQSKMPYSEIVNDLDTIKSELNSAMYKLTFLK